MKILIAVPTFENIKPECFKSIFGLDIPQGCNLYFDYIKGYDCARARNEIARLAINNNFDYVMMIDSDISIPRDALIKLLNCNSDIALGWYFKKRTLTDQTVIYNFGKDYNDKNMISGKTLKKINVPFDIKGGGLGIALINVNVFRKLPYPYFKYVTYSNGAVLSEDLYFCTQARGHEMNIQCNPNVKGKHIYEVSV